MKKCIIILLIVVIITLSLNNIVNAAYTEPLPDNTYDLPYETIFYQQFETGRVYYLFYTGSPWKIKILDFYGDGTGYKIIGIDEDDACEAHVYVYKESIGKWDTGEYWVDFYANYGCDDIVYCNYSMGYATTTFELEENQSSFFGIDFDYSGFFGDLKIQLGKKEESGTYKIIKEWQYPKGSGHVTIPAEEMPQGNKGEYIIIIYEGDTIINQYPYTLNVEEEPYCEINYPVNGQSYNYKPNVNIRYYNKGRLYIYINGEMYKQIQTKDREGIEVIEGNNELFDVGMNTVSVKDSNGQVVATVQFEVLREGPDPGGGIPEYDAEGWVQKIFDKIMNEYSLFFEYVRGIYGFLPVEIVGLVVIIMMLAVVLWFTGRK